MRGVTERGNVRYDWQHYISLVERKPGALRNGAPFADMPTPLLQLRKELMRDRGGQDHGAGAGCHSARRIERGAGGGGAGTRIRRHKCRTRHQRSGTPQRWTGSCLRGNQFTAKGSAARRHQSLRHAARIVILRSVVNLQCEESPSQFQLVKSVRLVWLACIVCQVIFYHPRLYRKK